MTWDELAKILNEELGCSYGSSAYRKPYTQAMEFYNEVFCNMSDNSAVQELREAQHELYKERTRLRDERNQMNKQLRAEARMDAFMDEVRDMLVEQFPIKVKNAPVPDMFGYRKEAIVCLSDLHVGVDTENSSNTYNTNVLYERLNTYLDEIEAIQKRHNIGTCYLCLLGDQISGSIHASITATNSMNTVRQIKTACNAISKFVERLSEIFQRVDIFSVSGNHSRVNSNKDDNIPGDNLDSLIAFYLEAALKGNDRVKIYNNGMNTYGYSRCFTTDGGRDVVIVHGDLDNPDRVVYNMTQLYSTIPDIILMGHMHHSAYNTVGKTRIIQSGCLSGVDGYAFNKRLFAPAEQTVVVTSSRKPVECIYNISLEDEEKYPFDE